MIDGAIGANLEAIDAKVNIAGGSVAAHADAFGASVYNISGGTVDGTFEAFPGSTINLNDGSVYDVKGYGANINVNGGLIEEDLKVAADSAVFLTDGIIEEDLVAYNSVVHVTGGEVGDYVSGVRSTLSISGGRVAHLELDASDARISGGAIGRYRTRPSSTDAVFVGNEFQLDGEPIEGLAHNGDTHRVELPKGSLLSGTLSDGTPFAVVNRGGTEEISSFTNIWVELSSVAPIGPPIIDLSSHPAPFGIRAGQELLVREGTAIGDHFMAGEGSKVAATGGVIGENLRAVGAEVEISSGIVGDEFHALHGTVATISDGLIGEDFQAYSGSIVNISGGSIGHGFNAREGSVVNITGGRFTYSESVFDGNLDAMDGSVVNISGGLIGVGLRLYDDSMVTMSGDHFRIDGLPVPGLVNDGDAIAIDVPEGSLLTGTLSDGTPLIFSRLPGNTFAGGLLHLRKSAPKNLDPLIVASVDTIPLGVAEGRTLLVDAGSEVAEGLLAGWGSNIVVKDGGHVGPGLRAYRARVEVEGGSIGDMVQLNPGSRMTISGGTVGNRVSISNDSELTMLSGSIGDHLDATSGSIFNMAGGTLGSHFEAYSGSVINISGGSVIGEFGARSGSEINLIGREFFLNGERLDELVRGEALNITSRNIWLSGRLLDGSEFSFYLSSFNSFFGRDYFDRNATLTVTLIPEPSTWLLSLIAVAALGWQVACRRSMAAW